MKNALILHGTEGHSKENWFPWLKKNLKEIGYRVWVPDLPNSENPDIDRYNAYLFPQWKLDSDSIVIGHSSGAIAALGFLQESNVPIVQAVYMISGFIGDLNWNALTQLGSFILRFDELRTKSKKFVLFHSDDDPYVPLDHGKILADKLAGELVVMKGQKHFSFATDPRYFQFPELLESIRSNI